MSLTSLPGDIDQKKTDAVPASSEPRDVAAPIGVRKNSGHEKPGHENSDRENSDHKSSGHKNSGHESASPTSENLATKPGGQASAVASSKQREILKALTAFLAVFVTFHVAIVCLMVAPTNYLQVRLGHIIHAYTTPIFTQDWKLFAPTPIASDTYISVKVKNAAGDETDFINLTQHFLDENRHKLLPTRTSWNLAQTGLKFFGAREELLQTVPSDALPKKPKLFLEDSIVNKGNSKAAEGYRASLEDMRRSVAAHILLDYPDATSMQIKLENVTFPSFQKRHDPNAGGMETDTTGWVPTAVDKSKDGQR